MYGASKYDSERVSHKLLRGVWTLRILFPIGFSYLFILRQMPANVDYGEEFVTRLAHHASCPARDSRVFTLTLLGNLVFCYRCFELRDYQKLCRVSTSYSAL